MEGKQTFLPMGPYDECVVNISDPEFGLKHRFLNGLLFQVFHKQVCNDQGERRTHGCTVRLLEVVILELEVRGTKAQLLKSYQLADGYAGSLAQGLIFVQLFFHYPQDFIDGDLGEKAGHIKAY